MAKYLVLYRSTTSAMEQMGSMSAADKSGEMQKWMAWGAGAGPALLDWGAPLGASAAIGGAAATGHVTGYSIVQADTIDAAKRLFDGHPHLGRAGDTIEIHEAIPMPGQ